MGDCADELAMFTEAPNKVNNQNGKIGSNKDGDMSKSLLEMTQDHILKNETFDSTVDKPLAQAIH